MWLGDSYLLCGKTTLPHLLLWWFPCCFWTALHYTTSHTTVYVIQSLQALCGIAYVVLPWSSNQSVVSRETARKWKMPVLTWHFLLIDTMWKTREPLWAGAPAASGAFLSAPGMCSPFPPLCAQQSSPRMVMESIESWSVLLMYVSIKPRGDQV